MRVRVAERRRMRDVVCKKKLKGDELRYDGMRPADQHRKCRMHLLALSSFTSQLCM